MTLRRRLQILVAVLATAGVLSSYWVFRLNVRHLKLNEGSVSDALFSEMLGAFISAALVLIGVVVLVWVYLERYVINPLEELRNELRAVASGDIHQIIEVSMPVEISRAAQDAENMRRSLVAQIDRTREAEQGIADNAPLVSHVRGALTATRLEGVHDSINVAGFTRPASGMIAGDWWDCIDVPGGVGIALVDVMGHGPQAGVTGLQIKSVLNAGLASGVPMDQLLRRISDDLSSVDSLLASAFVAVIPDDVNHPMIWINAGHPAALLQTQAGIQRLESSGPVLGALGSAWVTHSAHLPEGSRLVVVSDGLIESRDNNGVELGIAGLEKMVSTLALAMDPEEVGEQISHSAREVSATWDKDDVTVLAVTRRLVP